MTIEQISIGSAPNDGTGQNLRSGGQVINANFAELDTRTAAAQARADKGVADAATAQAKASAAVPGSAVGVSVAQLVDGVVPATQLPSYVDDVLEFPTRIDFPVTGESGKIYIAINDGDSPSNPTRQWRWGGTVYVLIPSSPGSTDQVPEGSINQYFTVARALSTKLTGLGALVNAAIVAGDTVLQAFAKLQGQLNAKLGRSEVAADSDKLGGQPAALYTATFVGATASTAGVKGLVPAPAVGDQLKFLGADGAYRIPDGPAEVIMNANGTATKFPDGTMICRAVRKESGAASIATGASLFLSNGVSFQWPVVFVGDIPVVSLSSESYLVGFSWAVLNTPPTLTGAADVRIVSPASGALSKVAVFAVGRWK